MTSAVGLWVLLPLKAVAIGLLYGLYRASPRAWRIGVPIGLVLVGSGLVAWNVSVVY
ncbi:MULTISPECIES: hypothetical protein [Halobacteriales]|uniref:Uncharacterized protein n=1 Tax=Halolamina salina TaxID=1220023 RepID=A0ABD6BAU7_9EURY|nr:hypothetical protein [Natrinema salifodinae]